MAVSGPVASRAVSAPAPPLPYGRLSPMRRCLFAIRPASNPFCGARCISDLDFRFSDVCRQSLFWKCQRVALPYFVARSWHSWSNPIRLRIGVEAALFVKIRQPPCGCPWQAHPLQPRDLVVQIRPMCHISRPSDRRLQNCLYRRGPATDKFDHLTIRGAVQSCLAPPSSMRCETASVQAPDHRRHTP